MGKTKTVIMVVGAFIAGAFIAPLTVVAIQKTIDTTATIDRGDGQMSELRRWDDPDFKVKCWESKAGYSGGISCLPWSEVKER